MSRKTKDEDINIDKETNNVVEENIDVLNKEENVIVVEPITTEEEPKHKEIKHIKNIDVEGRGFSSFEEAEKFIETKYFKGLGKEDQEEYLNWLKS